MTNLPLVSIIIPTYNRAEQTINAVDSALSQIYENIEVIVVDDGSPDQIVQKLSAHNCNSFSLVLHKKNRGANAARNTGLRSAKGEWIAFLDSDDTWEETKIQKMIEQLLQYPQYSVAYCNMHSVKGKTIVKTHEAQYSGDLYSKLLVKNVVGSASVPLIKKTVLDQVGGLDENLKSAQDWDLWLRIAEAGHKFLAIREAFVYYKIPDSENHISGSLDAFWEGRKEFINKHMSKYQNGHKKALGHVYSNIGFLLLNQFCEKKLARHCFWKAIQFNFFRMKSWKGLIGSLIPSSIYKNLISD